MIALFAHSLFSARSGVAEELGWCWNATQRTPQEHLGSVISTPRSSFKYGSKMQSFLQISFSQNNPNQQIAMVHQANNDVRHSGCRVVIYTQLVPTQNRRLLPRHARFPSLNIV
jgi:hypothetical protein